MITQVSPGLYRCPQPTGDDWKSLSNFGVTRVLCLELGMGVIPDGDLLGEDLNAEAEKIRVYHHPHDSLLPPSADWLCRGVRFLSTYRLAGGVAFHCKAGVDRTGMMCAAWRILKEDWSADRAIAEMRAMGMHPWYFYWVPVLRRLK